jgi:hypothetical protein
MVDSGVNMIKVGDLVMLKDAKIRDPVGTLRKLKEAPDYGIVLEVYENKCKSTEDDSVCRVMWFDCDGGARAGEPGTTLEIPSKLEKISK